MQKQENAADVGEIEQQSGLYKQDNLLQQDDCGAVPLEEPLSAELLAIQVCCHKDTSCMHE